MFTSFLILPEFISHFYFSGTKIRFVNDFHITKSNESKFYEMTTLHTNPILVTKGAKKEFSHFFAPPFFSWILSTLLLLMKDASRQANTGP